MKSLSEKDKRFIRILVAIIKERGLDNKIIIPDKTIAECNEDELSVKYDIDTESYIFSIIKN